MLSGNHYSFKHDLVKERPALNGYRTIAHVVEVLSPNRIIICFNISGINKCINVKINRYHCDNIEKNELQKKIENRLVEVQFKNNYELKWIKCVESEKENIIKSDKINILIPVGNNGVSYFGLNSTCNEQ